MLFWIFYFGELMFGIWRKLAKVRGGDNGEVNTPFRLVLYLFMLFVHAFVGAVQLRYEVCFLVD